MKHYKSTCITLFLLFLITTFIRPAKATMISFTVPRNGEETRTLNLAVEDHVLIKLTVVGSSDHSIHFSIGYPNNSVVDFGWVGTFSYAFVCNAEGACILHFSNIGSSEDKVVTLEYEVEHYIFGIPQMWFLTLFIAVVCVAAVASYILLGKPH